MRRCAPRQRPRVGMLGICGASAAVKPRGRGGRPHRFGAECAAVQRHGGVDMGPTADGQELLQRVVIEILCTPLRCHVRACRACRTPPTRVMVHGATRPRNRQRAGQLGCAVDSIEGLARIEGPALGAGWKGKGRAKSILELHHPCRRKCKLAHMVACRQAWPAVLKTKKK